MIRETFGPHLRAERERRGISLDSIAAQTKIRKSFLESLERGDFSKWPAGDVFRRAYIRDYAEAIGLSPESVFGDFIRLFPVNDASPGVRASRPVSAAQEDPSPLAPLALTLDKGPNWRARLASRRVRAAALDACGLFLLGGVLALLTGSSVWMASGILAFVYYPVTAALWGRSIALRYLEARSTVQTAVSPLETVADPLFLTGTGGSHSAHVPQQTTTH